MNGYFGALKNHSRNLAAFSDLTKDLYFALFGASVNYNNISSLVYLPNIELVFEAPSP